MMILAHPAIDDYSLSCHDSAITADLIHVARLLHLDEYSDSEIAGELYRMADAAGEPLSEADALALVRRTIYGPDAEALA